jgi:hypothetical protein
VQVAVTQGEFVKVRLPEARSAFRASPPPPSAPPPEIRLILNRVAAGEPVIYDTGKNGPVELLNFFPLELCVGAQEPDLVGGNRSGLPVLRIGGRTCPEA